MQLSVLSSLSTFFSRAYTIVNFFSYFIAFWKIFKNILKALFWVYIILPINLYSRINKGALNIRRLNTRLFHNLFTTQNKYKTANQKLVSIQMSTHLTLIWERIFVGTKKSADG